MGNSFQSLILGLNDFHFSSLNQHPCADVWKYNDTRNQTRIATAHQRKNGPVLKNAQIFEHKIVHPAGK